MQANHRLTEAAVSARAIRIFGVLDFSIGILSKFGLTSTPAT
jgi:hypothetical protein